MNSAATKARQILARIRAGETIEPDAVSWLALMIDHTLLKPGCTAEEIAKLCSEAKAYGFATVCVYPRFVSQCRDLLAGSDVKPIAVVGFPTGLEPTAQKVRETKESVQNGAGEIDMVIQIDWVKARRFQQVYEDIRGVVTVAGRAPVKVILETFLLSEVEKISASALAKAAGAAFVKTSTGFAGGGATAADVALLRGTVGEDIGVKASGGVRTLESALEMIAAGATRIGTSSGVAILGEKPAQNGGY